MTYDPSANFEFDNLCDEAIEKALTSAKTSADEELCGKFAEFVELVRTAFNDYTECFDPELKEQKRKLFIRIAERFEDTMRTIAEIARKRQ